MHSLDCLIGVVPLLVFPACGYVYYRLILLRVFFLLFVDRASQYIYISTINQLDAQNFCFTISLFHASTCFEHMCSSSGG